MNKENSPLVNHSLANKRINKSVSKLPQEVPVKFCKDCFHFQQSTDYFDETMLNHCTSPFNSYRDVVTGETKPRVLDCYQARQHDLFCGQEAKWFTPIARTSNEQRKIFL